MTSRCQNWLTKFLNLAYYTIYCKINFGFQHCFLCCSSTENFKACHLPIYAKFLSSCYCQRHLVLTHLSKTIQSQLTSNCLKRVSYSEFSRFPSLFENEGHIVVRDLINCFNSPATLKFSELKIVPGMGCRYFQVENSK